MTPRDAATLGAGGFQAIHHPLKLQRRRLGARSGGRWVSEQEIVKVFSGPLRADGYLFVPIVGGSGSGKSHLVRWVREQTEGTTGWESRYLAKNRTSIRRVIEIVIEGLTGPAIDAARDALETAPAQSEQIEDLADRLLDELALIVARDGDGHPEPADLRDRQLRAKVRQELPDVLRDPVVRRRFTAPGAVIPRLVGLALKGRQDGDGLDDDAIRVLEADFPLTFVEFGDVSKRARDLLGQMATISELLRMAVVLINEALPAAVKRVFISSQIDLIEVFRDVRRSLLNQKKDLVLFIEDLTVLHGVEREFLDAIIEPAVSPEGRLCNLRVIFAVTEGHFDGLDTVRTRCDDAYWLDASYGEEGVSKEEALSFLGRYLNSARLDPDLVEREWATHHNNNWLSNACTECEHQAICHDTFGASEEGYGLYPFNGAALGRFVAALSLARFDPREVVRELVNHFLIQGGADLIRGAFPSDELLSAFEQESEPLEPLLAAELRSLRPSDYGQLVNVMRYWSQGQSPLDVTDSILSAFGLKSLDREKSRLDDTPGGRTAPVLRPSKHSQSDGESPTTTSSVENRLKPGSRSHYLELIQWAGRNQTLSMVATRDLRNLIHRTVVQNLELGPAAINLGADFNTTHFNRDRDIVIEGSVTSQNQEGASIVVSRSESAAAALQGLLLISEIPDGDYPGADQFRRMVATQVEVWTAQVAERFAAQSTSMGAAFVEGMLLATTIGGHCDQAKIASDYLEVLFARPIEYHEIESVERTGKWIALVNDAAAIYPRLRTAVETAFGEARGASGGVRTVQAGRLLAIVEPFISTWTLESHDPAVDRLMRSVPVAMKVEWEALCDRATSVVKLLDNERSWRDQTEKVLVLLSAAHLAGRLRDVEALTALQHLAELAPEQAHRSVFRAAELSQSELPLQEQLRVVAGQLPIDVALVHAFASRANKAIVGIEDDLKERLTADGETNELPDVVERVLASTARFSGAVEGLVK